MFQAQQLAVVNFPQSTATKSTNFSMYACHLFSQLLTTTDFSDQTKLSCMVSDETFLNVEPEFTGDETFGEVCLEHVEGVFDVDTFANVVAETPPGSTDSPSCELNESASSEDIVERFTCKHNGILFENDIIQIGVKSEYREHLGRLGLFYGNKTQSQLMNFRAVGSLPPEMNGRMNIVVGKEAPTEVSGGAQVQQILNIECMAEFMDCPILTISYNYSGAVQTIRLKLPILLNKFFQSVDMDSQSFFSRWKALGKPEQECQKIFQAKLPMDTETAKAKLLGFGLSVLAGVDPNPENFVGAGILKLKSMQIGCLLRLEPNKQAQMYRMTLRSSNENAAKTLVGLLVDQF